MFVGHYGPSFAIKSIQVPIRLWVLFIAVQFLDVGWSVLVFLGVEKGSNRARNNCFESFRPLLHALYT